MAASPALLPTATSLDPAAGQRDGLFLAAGVQGGGDVAQPASHQAQARQIADELAAIAATGMVLPGSITQRHTRCGRGNCACHADPPRLHGPYWQWTRKIAAKTVCRWLSPAQREDYQAWIDNDRRLRDLLTRLEALGAAALEADPRWKRGPGPAHGETGAN